MDENAKTDDVAVVDEKPRHKIQPGATIKELQEQKNDLAAQILAMSDVFNADSELWNAEREAEWVAVNEDHDIILDVLNTKQKQREIANRAEAIRREQSQEYGVASTPVSAKAQELRRRTDELELNNRPLAGKYNDDEMRALALAGWLRAGGGEEPTEEQNIACQWMGIRPGAYSLNFNTLDTRNIKSLQNRMRYAGASRLEEIRNAPLTTQTAATGGDTIPPETMLRQMEVNMLAFGGVLANAEIIQTSSGEDLSWPTADDTGNAGRLVAENVVVDDNAAGGSSGDGGPNPAFAKKVWSAYKFTSDTILVPYELLEDSIFDIPSLLGAMLGERIGRIVNTYLTTGTGTAQPEGIVTGAAQGQTMAAAAWDVTASAVDGIFGLQHSIDPAYRNGASFMCHDNQILQIRKFKDADDRPLWNPSFQEGLPDRLAGSPLVINQDMDGTTVSTDKVLLYGQLSKMKVRRVNGIRLYRLEERYREKDQTGFVAFLRLDGGVLNAGTDPLKYLELTA